MLDFSHAQAGLGRQYEKARVSRACRWSGAGLAIGSAGCGRRRSQYRWCAASLRRYRGLSADIRNGLAAALERRLGRRLEWRRQAYPAGRTYRPKMARPELSYAEADNPHTREKARWRRLDAVVSGRSLTVTESVPLTAALRVPLFIATYDMDDDGQLNAFFKSGDRIARAAMNRTDLAFLTRPDAVVPWSRGSSELLQTDLRDDGNPIRLETVVFKPPGPGPFPLAVFNHGCSRQTVRPPNLSSKPGSRSKLPTFSTSEDGSWPFRSAGVAENPTGSVTKNSAATAAASLLLQHRYGAERCGSRIDGYRCGHRRPSPPPGCCCQVPC